MSDRAPELDRLVTDFHGKGRPRVWSLIITIFGDAVQPRGGRIAAVRLRQVLGRLGIESGAVRTALSRLVTEGWVTRESVGRHSFYRLSETGQAAFGPASERIFNPKWKADVRGFVLGVLPGRTGEGKVQLDKDVRVAQGFVLGPGCYGWSAGNAPSDLWASTRGLLVLSGTLGPVPKSVYQMPVLSDLRQHYADLLTAFLPLQVDGVSALAPLDAFAVRVLLIHHWRRIVLRYPDFPQALLPADWPAQACQDRVAEVYGWLLRPSEAWLDAGQDLPPPDAEFYRRFGGISSP